jgi:bifunctional non-homologous end joining protein LigD
MARELEEYREKRDFRRTPEPPPKKAANTGPLTFVVQKHRARQLHYDFRLEVDGVLKSWSVPKGPSLNPGDRRLAVRVDDHPLEYATFEGSIPKGEYGAGEVIVWDSGTYSPDEDGQLLFSDRAAAEKAMRKGLETGKLSLFLRGSKLKGSWALVKMQRKEKDWLLMKHRDDYVNYSKDILAEDESVITGRTVEDIKAGRSASTGTGRLNPENVAGARAAPYPAKVAPMLASLAEGPFSSPGWIYEPKLDGYRTIAMIREGKVKLLSRRGSNVTPQYGALVPDLSRQPASGLVLDGEIIAMDEKGQQCFQCLQNHLKSMGRGEKGVEHKYPLIYYVFDILYLDGYDLRGAALQSRKELLSAVLRPTSQVRPIDYFEKDGETVYEAAVKNGLEGVIAKETDSTYESGKRSRKWLKVKATHSDDFVIGGYSTAVGGRATTFSSLLLGYYNDKGKLVFAGHVGTGFDEKSLGELKKRLDATRTDKNPFNEEPPLNAPTTWVKPEMVAEVKYSAWTQDGRLRIPVFLRLRQDKVASEVRRTETVTVNDPPPRVKNSATDNILKQLQDPQSDINIEVEGNKISLSNLDKILWPTTRDHQGYTKRDLLIYLATAAPYVLPHLKDRPLTLSRYPNGIKGEHFWQKHFGYAVPDFVTKVEISEEKGSRSQYLICDNLATLLWLGQEANLELHTWFSRINAAPDMARGKNTDDYLDYPDFIIFDLDPYIYSGKEGKGEEPELNRAGFKKGCEIARRLKEILDELEMKGFIKTSGKTGIHIYVPVKRRLDYKAVRAAAETIGKYLVRKYPEEITTEWAQEKRRGKVFIDYGQNVRGKTLAAIYSPRPSAAATVSTPLRWEELGKVYPTDFTIKSLPERLKKNGDLWAGIIAAKQDPKKLSGKE